jgi:AcrR family transcriptional regulator
MQTDTQPFDGMRKTPTQARSQATVEVIVEAAARILERDGRAAFNTNAVAELAGISVGTLYHYFQSKDAILIAMARREIEAHQAVITSAVSAALGSREGPRAIVRALIEASSRRRRARQIAMDTLITYGLGGELAAPVRAIDRLLETENALPSLGASRPASATSRFVLTRAVSGVISAAAREASPPLADAELEDELVRLIEAYLDVSRAPFRAPI